jgi:hypothetical protein
MKDRASANALGVWMSIVFMAAALLPMMTAAGGASGEPNFEIESNDSYSNANILVDGQVTLGSLLTSSAYDITDYYKIFVPRGMVINVSLYMIDYNESDFGEYNFQLHLYRFDGSQSWLSFVEWSRTANRWETVGGYQGYADEMTYYIMVQTNWSSSSYPYTRAGHYSVSASLSAPLEKGHDAISGELASDGPDTRDFYVMTEQLHATEQMRVRLASPPDSSFSVCVYLSWARDPDALVLQNGSWDILNGSIKEVVIGGSEGTYYIMVKARCGGGRYVLSTEIQSSEDGNNIPSMAQALTRSGLVKATLDQGADIVDWFRLNVRAGYCIPSISLAMGMESTYTWNPVNLTL